MNLEQFVKDANRTVSDNFHGENVGIEHFIDTSMNFERFGNTLDDIKKAIFYGRYDLNENKNEDCTQLVNNISVNNLHGIIGIATEATELIQAMLKPLTTGYNLDIVNISEEIGDIIWYIALLCQENDLNLESIMNQNIEKLKLRYPEKFTEDSANIRDLDAERKLLDETTNVT